MGAAVIEGLRGGVVEYSATLSSDARAAVLQSARGGGVSVLVTSDLASRGLDLPALPCVVQYDPAPKAKGAVHRLGRAARAGAVGLGFSFVQPEQTRHFLAQAGRLVGAGGAPAPLSREHVPKGLLEAYAVCMKEVLSSLSGVLGEERGGLPPTRAVPRLSLALPPLDGAPTAVTSGSDSSSSSESSSDSDGGSSSSSSSSSSS